MITFGWSLRQFVNSVDYLTDDVFEAIKTLTHDYLLRDDGFGACYFSVLRPGIKVDGEEALKIIWSSDPNTETNVVRLYGDDGKSIPSLRAFAYRNKRPIWIMDKNRKKLLTDKVQLENLWPWPTDDQPDNEKLPKYIHMHSDDAYTFIAAPLRNLTIDLGLLVIEFSSVIPHNSTAQEEVELIRESCSQLIWLHDITQEREKGTRTALKCLEENVGHMFSSVRPTLFFAYSSKADEKVLTIIREVLTELKEHFELRDWQEMTKTGEINDQIIREISRCRYGICYFSEEKKEEDEKGKKSVTYTDNSNVLVEAGMLQALRGGNEGEGNWIPIREGTTPAPFDLSGQRTINIQRKKNGTFNATKFEEEFRKMLADLLSVPSMDETNSQKPSNDL